MNKIKHNFNRITAKALLKTNVTRENDIIHVYKNNSGYLGLNTNTGNYFYIPLATLKNENVFLFIETI